MCGRYVLRVILKNLARDFPLGFEVLEADLPPVQRPRFNIAPTQMVSVIRIVGRERRHSILRWGLIPHWWKNGRPKIQINARSETLLEKPYFRDAARKRRCLILADGFYEWKRDANDKPLQAYFIERIDGRPFVMAGIWESWISPDGEAIETVAIVTTSENADVRPVHHRMPLILAQRDYLTWLEAERFSGEEAIKLCVPAPDGTLIARSVSDRANAVRNDDAANLEPDDPNTPKPSRRKDTGQGSLF